MTRPSRGQEGVCVARGRVVSFDEDLDRGYGNSDVSTVTSREGLTRDRVNVPCVPSRSD